MSNKFSFYEAVTVPVAQRAEMLVFACDLARQAGAAALPFFRADVKIDNKLSDGRYDPVTEADKAVEQAVRQRLADTYPQHGVFGEEFGFQSGNGLTWVVDPIDGTRAFMTGMLHWGLLIALFNGEEPILGVMYQPFTDELFYGEGTHAWYRQGQQPPRDLKVSRCAQLDDAVLTSTGPQYFSSDGQRVQFQALEDRVKFARYGGDCYIYAMLAMGYVDIAFDPALNPYDIQALIPIIRGAGGVVTTWEGGDPCMGGSAIASASMELHQQALAVLQAQRL